ncbi:hypothetical protein ACP4OV_024837 [Aristida adscensionis]
MGKTDVFTVKFDGNDINTTVTSSGEAVKDWIDGVRFVHRHRLHKLIVGLDVEWRPTFSSERSPTALLQLCVGRRCLIFQLLHADHYPAALWDFLGESDFRFAGVGVDDDARRLSAEFEGLEVANTVDLRELAADGMGRPDLRHAGLKAIASAVMDVDIEKPQWVRTGPWDAYSLSNQQIRYDCIDAFVAFEICRKLSTGDY